MEWIIIGSVAWLVCGLLTGQWVVRDDMPKSIAYTFVVIVWPFFFLIMAIDSNVPFLPRNKRKVYWDEKAGQIMAGKECVFDKIDINKRFNHAVELVNCSETKINTIKHQLQCSAKHHGKWVYQKKDFCFNRNGPELTCFFFKCDICGLGITKSKDELTAQEKGALTTLKL